MGYLYFPMKSGATLRYTLAMARAYDEVVTDAMALSRDERRKLADFLYDSLLEPTRTKMDATWPTELERRSRNFDPGKTTAEN
jgi:putative addiction module component (TIGR02574 family)